MSARIEEIPAALRSRYIDVVNMPWTQLSEKSFRKELYRESDTGRVTWLARLLPGAVIPFHEHPDVEQTYVLDGKLVDDEGECTAGNFVWRPAGSRHTARAPEGCVFLAFFGKMSERRPDAPVKTNVSPEHASRYIDVRNMPWAELSPKSSRKLLYNDPVSGRHTWLSRQQPGGVIPFHEHPDIEQTFVLEGKLVDDEGECTAGNFVWRPAGSRHTARAPEGCQFIAFFGKASRRLPEAQPS